MCFSAPASFIASGGLATAGAASFRIARGRWRMIAAIPLLFAVQQALEGLQWLAIGNGSPSEPMAYGYLFFALLWWPVYLPFVTHRLDAASRKRSRWFLYAGIAVAAWSAVWLIINGVDVTAAAGHIDYGTAIPATPVAIAAYLAAVAGAPLVSRFAAFRWFGALILAEAVLAYLFWQAASASVWCFFAAATSVLIYLYLRSDSARWAAKVTR